MRKLFPAGVLAGVLVMFFTGNAWAVYCPVGGAIYHRSGEESEAIAKCTEYIRQARASGQKIPNERAWRASKVWSNIPNSQPYPLSWASSDKDTKQAPAKQEIREVAKPEQKTAERATPKPIREIQPPAVAQKSPLPVDKNLAAAQPTPLKLTAPVSESVAVEEKTVRPVLLTATQNSNASEAKPAEAQAAPIAIPAVLAKERRVALVIGNGKYTAQGSLDNPRNDAEAVATALREIGFQSVTVLHDIGRDRMVEALQNFASEADDADWAVIYYAGHGMEVGGSNYLIPVDAKLKVDRDVQFESVALDHVLNSVESARKLRLVILDACRDNPFLSQMRRTVVSRSIGRGLAPIETDRSMLVFFAAKHGQISLDRVDGKNSPFTTSLVHWIKMPGVEINKVLRHVRDDVLKLTRRSQEPYQYGSLSSDDFYFRPVAAQANKN